MIVLIRGGGDLASGVALRLHRCGFRIVIAELEQPLAVRRKVAFAQAVYSNEITIEGLTAKKVTDPTDTFRVLRILTQGQVAVLVDPEAHSAQSLHPTVIVDARMRKLPPEPLRHLAKLYLGLGPGFEAPRHCHAVIETNRGHHLGRVIWQGSTEADTRLPEAVGDYVADRVLRAPADGLFQSIAEIGAVLEPGQPVAEVAGQVVVAPFRGVLRGLLYPGLQVTRGMKIGDLDPRADPVLCTLVSDKALAVAGGVLEAIFARPELRPHLWT